MVATTIVAATATLVVTGSILFGPAITSCLNDADGVTSCLRDQLMGQPVETAPPADGWLAAHATEPPLSASSGAVDLTLDNPGKLESAATPWVVTTPELALNPGSDVAAAAIALRPSLDPVQLDGSASGLTVEAVRADETEVGTTELIGSAGAVLADSLSMPPVDAPAWTPSRPEDGALAASALPPLNAEAASIPVEPAQAAMGSPVEVATAPIALVELAPAPDPVPVAPEPPPGEAIEEPPLVSYDPAFPNVLVLPAPISGEGSSFRTLIVD